MDEISKADIAADMREIQNRFYELAEKLSNRGVRDAVIAELKSDKSLRDRFRDQLVVLQCDHGLPGYVTLVTNAVAKYDRDCTASELTKYQGAVKKWYFDKDDLKNFSLLEYLWDYVYEGYADYLQGILVDIEFEKTIAELDKVIPFGKLPEACDARIFESIRNFVSHEHYLDMDEDDLDMYYLSFQPIQGGQILVISKYPNANCNQVHLFMCSPFFFNDPRLPLSVTDYFCGFSWMVNGIQKFMIKSKLTGEAICGHIDARKSVPLFGGKVVSDAVHIKMDTEITYPKVKLYFPCNAYVYQDLKSSRNLTHTLAPFDENRRLTPLPQDQYQKLQSFLELFER